MTPDQVTRAARALECMMNAYNLAYERNNRVDDAETDFERGDMHGASWMLDALFGENDRFRVERELKAKFGLTMPHPGRDVPER